MARYLTVKAFTLFFLSTFLLLNARAGAADVPPGITYKITNAPPVMEMPLFDSIRPVFELRQSLQQMRLKNLQFAYNYDVNARTHDNGEWLTLPDGSQLWRLDIVSKGAKSMALIFDSLCFHVNQKLYVYNPSNIETLQTLNFTNNTQDIYYTLPIDGDRLRLEYIIPTGTKKTEAFSIAKVSHAYLDVHCIGFGCSAPCNVDINCAEGTSWQSEKRAIVKIYVPKGATAEVCTGTLIGNTSNDKRPFVITANHCLTTYSQAQGSIFTFNYESPTCKGVDGNTTMAIHGATLKSTSIDIDFTLVELKMKPPAEYNPYYAGWSRDTAHTSYSAAIHHPWGDVKKITKSYTALGDSSFWKVYDNTDWLIQQWEVGTTEKGSSGGPLFDQNHRLIGTLVGGDASCDFPHHDMYLKFYKAWDLISDKGQQLKYWLDSLNTNKLYIDGDSPTMISTIDKYENGVLINPVPAVDNLQASFLAGEAFIKYEIADISGSLLLSKPILKESTEIFINLSSFRAGVYFVRFYSTQKVVVKKFLIVK